MNRLFRSSAALAATFLLITSLDGHAAGPGARAAPKAAAPARVHQFGDPSIGFLVKFKPGLTEEQMAGHLASRGLAKAKRFKTPRRAPHAAIGRWWHVTLADPENGRMLRQLKRDALIERIEANHRVKASGVPDDPQFPAQWGLHNIGQSGGAAGADIDAPEAWDVQTGSPEIVVAVLDTGINHAHPDLAGNIWTNPGEIPGNGLDDDGNWLIDDVHGYDFFNWRPDPMDDGGHGTHVAGIIGAVANNGIGVAGVNWRVRLMSVKVLDWVGGGFLSDTISGLHYAVDMGARVVNVSLSTDEYSQALADALSAADEAGVLVVAAAGNTATNNDASPRYPASLALPNLIAVAATTPADALASFSNSGPASVLLGAPGAGILSTVPVTSNSACCRDPSGYKALDGTSKAAAFVSGTAALLLAQDPTRTPAQLKRLLWTSSDRVAGLVGRVASGGRLNAARALSCVPGEPRLRIITPVEAFKAYNPKTTRISAELASCDSGVAGASVTASFSSGDASLTLYDDGAHGDGAAGDGVYANDWSPIASGPVTVAVTAALPGFEAGAAIVGNVRALTSYRTEPAPYNWIDTSAGTQYVFGSLTVVTTPIGFNFNFYGEDRDRLTISLNGYVTFDPQPLFAIFWPDKALPDDFPPNDLISAYGDMMEPGLNTRIHTLLEGAAPERRLTITWEKVLLWSPMGEGTFQMTLYEGTNDIVFRYQDTTFGSFDNHGASAAVGTEDRDAFEATNWLGSVPDGTALRLFQTSYNHRPVAHPGGPYTGFVNQPITFDGSRSSDPNGDGLTYRWRFDPFIISSGTGVSPTFTYRSKGRFLATLIVNDGTLDSEPATVAVDIPNRPPVANVGGPYTGLGMEYVQFNGTGTDPDGDDLSFMYTVRDAGGQTYSNWGAGYFPPGNYTVTLVVMDAGSQSAPSTTTLTVLNQPPIVNLGADLTAARGQTVQLAPFVQDRDGQVVAYAWRQVSGPAVPLGNTTSPQLTFTIPKSFKAGDLVFEVTVTDNLGGRSSDQQKVTVAR